MQDELQRSILARSDAELYEMLYVHREDWRSEALELAEEEWKRRNLNIVRQIDAKSIVARKENENKSLQEEPLSFLQKVLFFFFNYIFCFGVVQFIIADIVFNMRGYSRKYRDSFIWMAYGTAAFVLSSMLWHWIST
jgi:hypothetical protein